MFFVRWRVYNFEQKNPILQCHHSVYINILLLIDTYKRLERHSESKVWKYDLENLLGDNLLLSLISLCNYIFFKEKIQ